MGNPQIFRFPLMFHLFNEADNEKSLAANVATNQSSQSKNVKTVEQEHPPWMKLEGNNRLTSQEDDEGNKKDKSDMKEKGERQSTQEWEDDFESDDEVKATASKGACEDVEENVVQVGGSDDTNFKMPHVESQTLSTLSSKLEQAKPTESPAVETQATGNFHAVPKGDLVAQEYEEAFEESFPRALLPGSRTETDIEDADVMVQIPEVEAACFQRFRCSWVRTLLFEAQLSSNKPGGENNGCKHGFYLEALGKPCHHFRSPHGDT